MPCGTTSRRCRLIRTTGRRRTTSSGSGQTVRSLSSAVLRRGGGGRSRAAVLYGQQRSRMNGVGMVANCQREAAIECAAGVAEFLGSRGRAVQMAPDLAVALGRPELGLPEDRLGEAEFLLAFGGDGTLLAANRAAAPHRTPVLGVHVGGPASFGFMMEATPAGAIEAVTAVLEQRCRIEERIMVAAEVLRAGACVRRYSALNDLVIRAESRMLKLRVEISGEYIATYAADGIILATPTGST
ncbi:MAG: NAD(+)/NADH kinase, partial [Armatimonadetes bacterium]|nr:NAD(+)/NADH kinase [Armatimonadota bacterium]